ncbi:hypothetical protein [Planococcus faecalis]|uniref:hypothetical protein n=1 Tax=Planococcus faecalis TaxID=1598147 RepID=UPI0008DAA123|nr:hypothetical protein [Planococcus faecalis]OHX51827.1 hypothetical protein BB777_14750 [Planococcus faecalis]
MINAAYLRLRNVEIEMEVLPRALSLIWTELYDAKTTMDSIRVVDQIMDRAEFMFETDAIHSYYTFGEALEKVPPFHYHEGIESDRAEEPEEIDTIEEWFESWHRETEMSEAPAMEFELERGDSQLAEGGREEEGTGDVEQTAKGDSKRRTFRRW